MQVRHKVTGAVLWQGESLRHANLRHANLRDANLRGADLRGADLCDADLCGVTIDGAIVDKNNIGGPGWILCALTDVEWNGIRDARHPIATEPPQDASGGAGAN